MKCPASTYRIQLSPEFTFEDLKGILDYLEQLGVSTIYSAPFFKARKGSTHGYDITDPFLLNPEIGKLETFKVIGEWLRKNKMSWLQDIVPNHMAYDGSNKWLKNILELGPESPYYGYFDIDWQEEKVMAAFLGDPLDEVLQNKELTISLNESGFSLKYYDNSYPLSVRSYAAIFAEANQKDWQEKFSGQRQNWKELKTSFLKEVQENEDLKDSIAAAIRKINATEAELKKILKLQYFEPVHWKKTEEKINYRRFFTINGLICLKMEKQEVFRTYHGFIKELVDEGLINGLRIDHIDGLFDPPGYLEQLREMVGKDYYIIIEKILEWDEKLPKHWPVQGTSGYGFLAEVNQLFTQSNADELFTENYHNINPVKEEYEDLVYHQKLFILWERMGGEFNNLWQLAFQLELLTSKENTTNHKNALGAFLAAFPVYRIYPEEFPLKKKQKKIIEQAYQTALEHGQHLEAELGLLKELFLGEANKDRENMFHFLQRCQQYTGPLAAKGVEDTTFYIFNRLISHNEVGDSPENFGLSVPGFHQRMEMRLNDFPLSINATATHDTKRGEDARMRINVVSELGNEWFQKVEEWKGICEQRDQDFTPDMNEKYFIFQMLVGAFPYDLEIGQEFVERSEAYLQKALREAKVHSSWAEPNTDYETAVFDFLKCLLREEKFLSSFLPFQKKVMAYGVLKSLGQCLIKVTAPGIPDIYQGTELWDLSYVDPDNRRPVDYELRKKYLSEISGLGSEDTREYLQNLKKRYSSGKIKMYCLFKALKERRQFPGVFEQGEYLALKLKEPLRDKVLAYARKFQDHWYLAVVPVMVTDLFNEQLQPKEQFLDEPVLELPNEFPGNWKNLYTEEILETSEKWTVNQLFGSYPVVLLTNKY
ncbi:maltooligosyl trehalose synthase [Salinimicrobium catena]|uniref:Maltooligosyl trehalose synthase n=1 Tax=Salinimicrobium catena TaxID=390640 RepID=A0A1H5M2L7_9FLAO|nr:malto-oligosyltrehalose synthase [Salinimicrobium catena]SDL17089.1 (1->4)-alpha-D-glucan 1-alpha-D-glucosylmutase [Salinimicrobium catena]SEE82901.1 maltooligosyl trehalose synthase [Salinimicrobium catena]